MNVTPAALCAAYAPHLTFLQARQDKLINTALSELKNGKKRGCYTWHVFPCLRDLATSRKGEVFGLKDLDEARAYLAHPVLGANLAACCEALLLHKGTTIDEIFPAYDVPKLRASMTLFEQADPHFSPAGEVLDTFLGGQRDPFTLYLLNLQEKGDLL